MIFIWLLMLGTLTSCQSCSSEYKNVNEIIVEELEIPVPLGDPFILLHNGTYYAYGTHSDEGIEVYISDNLKTWKYKGLALNKKDSWADRWFWVSVSAILSCRPFFILIFLPCIKMNHYGFSRKSIWKNLETFP